MRELAKLQEAGLISHLGTTNFDTDHLHVLAAEGIRIATNQVCFSLLDRRAAEEMSTFCAAETGQASRLRDARRRTSDGEVARQAGAVSGGHRRLEHRQVQALRRCDRRLGCAPEDTRRALTRWRGGMASRSRTSRRAGCSISLRSGLLSSARGLASASTARTICVFSPSASTTRTAR